MISTYHCAYHPLQLGKKPCDHSDEKRLAILGGHHFKYNFLHNDEYYTIPIIDVKYPEHGKVPFMEGNWDTHDFAIMVLKTPAKFSEKINSMARDDRRRQRSRGSEAKLESAART